MAQSFLLGYEDRRPVDLTPQETHSLPLFEAVRNIFTLGVPARHVNEWGRAYLSDHMVDTLLLNIRRSLAQPD